MTDLGQRIRNIERNHPSKFNFQNLIETEELKRKYEDRLKDLGYVRYRSDTPPSILMRMNGAVDLVVNADLSNAVRKHPAPSYIHLSTLDQAKDFDTLCFNLYDNREKYQAISSTEDVPSDSTLLNKSAVIGSGAGLLADCFLFMPISHGDLSSGWLVLPPVLGMIAGKIYDSVWGSETKVALRRLNRDHNALSHQFEKEYGKVLFSGYEALEKVISRPKR